jgi:hypothetical protein
MRLATGILILAIVGCSSAGPATVDPPPTEPARTTSSMVGAESIRLYRDVFALAEQFHEAFGSINEAYKDPSIDGDAWLVIAETELAQMSAIISAGRTLDINVALPGTPALIRDFVESWSTVRVLWATLQTAVTDDLDQAIAYTAAINSGEKYVLAGCRLVASVTVDDEAAMVGSPLIWTVGEPGFCKAFVEGEA